MLSRVIGCKSRCVTALLGHPSPGGCSMCPTFINCTTFPNCITWRIECVRTSIVYKPHQNCVIGFVSLPIVRIMPLVFSLYFHYCNSRHPPNKGPHHHRCIYSNSNYFFISFSAWTNTQTMAPSLIDTMRVV